MKIRVLVAAWLLAIASGAAHALGLGEIMVNSRLNQPLNAEILVREAVPGEAEQLVAKLASQEDFTRVGLERSRMPVMLRFETGTNARGQTVIKVMSDEPVREPFLTLLVEANWSGGRLLREYGVLLDPPVSAPASTITRTAPPQAAPAQPAPPPAIATPAPAPAAPRPAETAPLVEQQRAPAPAPPPAAAPAPRPSAPPAPPAPAVAQPAPAPRASSTPPPGFAPPAQAGARPPAPPAAPVAAPVEPPPVAAAGRADGSYTVQRGDTLYGIAREFAADAGVSADQMMVALQRGNTSAFFNDNINNLKAGVVLRIPDTDSARALQGSEASAEVRRQNAAWSTAAAAPTLADAGAAPARTVTPPSAPATDARLELVPPKSDVASDNPSAGRAGNEQGGSDVAEVQGELQRAREDLRSRDQEVSELGSRVRDLEELNAKNARLLELKSAEVAELQRRLAETDQQAAETAAAALTPAPESSAEGSPPAEETAMASSDTVPTTTDAAPETADTAAGTTDGQNADADVEPANAVAASDDAISSVGNDEVVDASASPLADESVTSATGEDVSEAEWEASATSADSDPFADANAPEATADTWVPGEPEVDESVSGAPATAVAPAVETSAPVSTAVEPTASTQPWYMQPVVQGAALIGLALILLLVMLARRQRKPSPDTEAPKRSVSDLFGEGGPVAATGIGAAATLDAVAESDDAVALQSQIERDPDDFGAYLELLSLYYADGDRSRFELWAERFYDRPGSEDSVEWSQVEGMGEELLPDHPLFGGEEDDDADLIVEETSQVAHPAWADEPMMPVATDDDDVIVDDERATAQPMATADVTQLSTDGTRRVYDIGGTDFTMDVGNDDPADDGDSRPIEFSLDDLDTPPAERIAPATSEDRADESDEALPPLAFGVDEPPVPHQGDSDAVPTMDRGYLEADSDIDGDDDGGLDDAATKLELARAYLDMGDPEGARAMLEEVLGEGDTSQRDEARKLLATL